jgi:hypothetical protein
VQGGIFTGTDDQRIKQAVSLDLELKAGKGKLNLTAIRDQVIKGIAGFKDEDIVPPDTLKGLSDTVVKQFVDGFNNSMESHKGEFGDLKLNTDQIIDIFKTQLSRLGGKLPQAIEATDIFGNPITVSFSDLFDTSKIANDESLKALEKFLASFRSQVSDFQQQIKATLESTKEGLAINIGEGLAAAINGDGLESALQGVASIMGDFIQELGKLLIKEAITVKAFKEAFKTLLANPAAAVAVGIGLVALGGIIKNVSLPKPKHFAAGGLVSGPTLGLVGEGVGTNRSNPEVIAPLDKLKQFIKPSQGIVAMPQGEWKIRGRDLVFAMAQTQKSQRRAT